MGGTQFTAVFSDVNEEGNDISGGGFSNQFVMPKWQQEVQSDPDLSGPDLPEPRFTGRISFPRFFLENF